MQYKKTITLLSFPMPKVIQFEGAAGAKNQALNFDSGIPVKDLSEEEAKEYAEFLKQEFFDHWKQEREVR